VSATDVWASEGAPTAPLSGQIRPDGATQLPIYGIAISQANWDILNANLESDVYVSGDFSYNGQTWTNVGLRYRGRVTRSVSKKSWKVKFNEFVPGQRFIGNQEEIGLDSLGSGRAPRGQPGTSPSASVPEEARVSSGGRRNRGLASSSRSRALAAE
jgi:hypothetical protein